VHCRLPDLCPPSDPSAIINAVTQTDDPVVRFACPRCLTRLKAPSSQAGTKRRCPRCQRVFEVPTAAQVARRHRQVGEYGVSEGMEPSPAEAQPHVTVTCPVCLTTLRAALDQVGRKLVCPDCDTPVVVPPPVFMEHKRSLHGVPVEQYALWDEVDPSSAGPRPADQTYVPVTCPVCGTFMQVLEARVGEEITCPDCHEPIVVSRPVKAEKKGAAPAAEIGEYALCEEAETSSADAREAGQTLFPLHCPLCQALMYAGRDQVGQEVVCRDCGDYFVVPQPPPPRRKPDLRSQAAEVYGVGDAIELPEYRPLVLKPRWRLRPGTGSATDHPGRERPGSGSGEAPDTAGLADQGAEAYPGLVLAPVPQRPPRWTFFSGIFGFPAYRGSWQRWLGLSLGLILPWLVGRMAVNLAMAPAGPWVEAVPWIVSMGLFGVTFVLGSIWGVVAAAQCLSIVRDTADGCDQIENWPDAVFLDWIGEFFFFVSSLGIAALPGVVLARALETTGVPGWLTVSISLLLIFPISLLSLLETNSPLNPFSLPVWRSLVAFWWAWGLFYVETTVVVAAAGYLAMLAATRVPIAGIALAVPALSVGALMVYFRLLGRLAWRCGRAATRQRRPPAAAACGDDREDQ
jgi:DNA-directed RNA polymerase subunit M/transcription elongation factor TFIIS